MHAACFRIYIRCRTLPGQVAIVVPPNNNPPPFDRGGGFSCAKTTDAQIEGTQLPRLLSRGVKGTPYIKRALALSTLWERAKALSVYSKDCIPGLKAGTIGVASENQA